MKGDAGFPVRLRFSKRGKVRFVGHRDIARAFERAFRIVGLPLAFTQGFSPRPKVSFGLALTVGAESDAEYLDVELTEPVDDLRGRDLVDAVVAVTGALVHHRGFQQGRLVIPAQCPHAQVGQPRELPDGQHPHILDSLPGGESTA